ncbi:MAG TPA: DUF1254 domain-containing protein [Candidatus Dormibacteraeota bacterium]|nr:DUF1254 domain-containing protein [Candidatus Dormibacteraeota bacterium]
MNIKNSTLIGPITLWLLCAFLSPLRVVADPPPDPATITALAADAYVWGLGPEFIERFSLYNTIISQPFNALVYSPVPAAWNNQATNAGDASVVYVSAFINFEENHELVLTVPPSLPVPPRTNQYYVVAYYDAYGNTISSIGTRTTPSNTATSYLLVGPKSPFAHKKTARIRGYEYPVVSSDTNINWFLIRVYANTLIDSSDPESVPNIVSNVQEKLALNTLHEFQANGHQPVYPASFITPPPTQQELEEAAPYQSLPDCSVDPDCAEHFFTQLGDGVAINPIPKANTGLSGTPLSDLPAWMTPQAGATTTYFVPSYGQQAKFDSFAPLGLKRNGFHIPHNWGQVQLDALKAGYKLGQNILTDFIHSFPAEECANYWGILNDPVGTYPNDELGYLFRSFIVVEGGVANVALDAVYPTLVNLPLTPGGTPEPLDGNNTYKITFFPPTPLPSPSPCASPGASWPVSGIYPPMVLDDSGNPKGFWSIHVYATDPMQSAAPFIAQTSLLNTSYSIADTAVISVDAAANTMTVNPPNWGTTIISSTPILFGENATDYGLAADTVYYAVCSDSGCQNADGTYTFQLSTQWHQTLDTVANPPVPIQGPGGNPGPLVNLLAGSGALNYGMVKPVTQLGSAQLAANQLATNSDGSLTLWFGPTLPAGVAASNWIPTPNSAYYNPLYGQQISTAFQLTLRMYYPTPGDQPPSILPCPACTPAQLPETYVPPTVELVQ